MRYAPPGLCLNDFTLLDLADGYHVLHLQGPWSERFDERSMETSYGHARSADLVEWETLGPCFGVGRPGSFDSAAIWTMHAFPCAGGTAMAYTGVRSRTTPEQAVGLAFTVVALTGALLGLDVLTLAATALARVAAVLNAAVGLCLGCEAYLIVRRLAPRQVPGT